MLGASLGRNANAGRPPSPPQRTGATDPLASLSALSYDNLPPHRSSPTLHPSCRLPPLLYQPWWLRDAARCLRDAEPVQQKDVQVQGRSNICRARHLGPPG